MSGPAVGRTPAARRPRALDASFGRVVEIVVQGVTQQVNARGQSFATDRLLRVPFHQSSSPRFCSSVRSPDRDVPTDSNASRTERIDSR